MIIVYFEANRMSTNLLTFLANQLINQQFIENLLNCNINRFVDFYADVENLNFFGMHGILLFYEKNIYV
jgi:hypothetical protein